MEPKWYHGSYRRHLLDMHYEDWDESILSKFEPEEHVEMLKLARVKSAVIFTNSHVGLSYWPSSRVPMHRGIHGRDIVGETIALFKEAGIDPILYMSFIYDNWAYETHPQWRCVDADGKTSREWAEGHRYGLCCPSTGYTAFAVAQTEEVCSRYDAVSIHPDMLFWNSVCVCPACRDRFQREVGGELPEVIDWGEPRWIAFQRKREEWMTQFADAICAAVKRVKPAMTVSIQSSAAISAWMRGYAETEIRGSDYSYGDLYGGLAEESFACKFYHNFSPNLPFQYETNFCDVDWTEHAIRKPPVLMELQAFTALAHNGAFLFIDPIDPLGLHQNPKIYAEMGRIFAKVEQVEPWLGGRLCEDVGIYYSLRSNYNPDEKGNKTTERKHGMPHLDAAMGAASVLAANHIPFGVTNKNSLADLGRYQVLVLPDVLMLDDEEAEAICAYVSGGGSLYASSHTFHPALAEVLGLQPLGETHETVTYVNRLEDNAFMPETFSGYPITIHSRQPIVRSLNPCEVMAVVNLPMTDPADRDRFVSIHSNPPGSDTDYPAVIFRTYGRGKVMWSSAAFEAIRYAPHKEIFIELINKLLIKPASFQVDGPAQVEMTLLHRPDRQTYLATLLNLQETMPPLSVSDLTVRVQLKGQTPKSVVHLPDMKPYEYVMKDGMVEIKVDRLELYEMIGITY